MEGMKNMKKVFAIVMALCLMLGMGVTAFALVDETTHYGIFINNERYYS